MRSCLYRGTVWHTRSRLTNSSPSDRAPAYRFAYSVWYLGLNLAERDEVDARLRLFSRNRHNVTSFWDSDYEALSDPRSLSPSPNPLPPGEEGLMASPESTTQLLTMPRFLNHVFNPFSVYITRDAAGAISDATAEVHNTWGERHLYHLSQAQDAIKPSSSGGRGLGDGASTRASTYAASVGKAFYVSPFISPEGRYHVELQEDPQTRRLQIRIDESDEDGTFFQAGIDLTPLPLTDANLLRLLVRFPFVNLKTVAMIHWHGIKLWLRGEPFRRNPSRARRRERVEEVRP